MEPFKNREFHINVGDILKLIQDLLRKLKNMLTSVDIKVDCFAETVAQSVQLGAQDLDGNIAGSSTKMGMNGHVRLLNMVHEESKIWKAITGCTYTVA